MRVRRPGERRSLSRSATRALDILELFGATRRPLRAVEIARTLDAHPSSINQLLKTMLGSGHLVFDAKGKTYLPSPRLAEFGAWIAASYGGDGRLRDLVAEVHSATGMTVTVSTPNDLFMQLIDSIAPEGQQAERGLSVSLFGSAIGSACLSMLDDAEVLRLADRARVPTIDVPAVLAALAQVRAAGFADGASPESPFWSIAVPLPIGALPAVLGLAGPRETVLARRDELANVLRAAAARFA